MPLEDHVDALETAIGDARRGLPEPVFDFLCRVTPIVNVDLLIRDQCGQTLLTWREDDLYLGWHVPGGVVRFKERMADRVAAVARTELGATVDLVRPEPLAIHEVIQPVRIARGHFISFLFECALTSPLDAGLAYGGTGTPGNGQWAWHGTYPPAMIGSHEMYRRFIAPEP